jgi:hypothetical protein
LLFPRRHTTTTIHTHTRAPVLPGPSKLEASRGHPRL